MPIYTDPDSGVTYDVSAPNFLGLVSVVVTQADGSTETFNNVPNGNVLQSDGGTLNLVAIPILPTHYFIPPTIDGSITTLLALGGNTIFHIGGTAVINTGGAALSGTTINVDGGDVTYGSGVAAGLTGTTVNLNSGGTFTGSYDVLNFVTGTTINFDDGGGTFVIDSEGAFINIAGLTINSFDVTTDQIKFANLPTPLNNYTISTDIFGNQTIIGFDADGNQLLSFTVTDGTFPSGAFLANEGPLHISEDGGLIIAACFLAGTMVATPNGAVAIETLTAGDLVLTSDGVAKPVRWLARQTVSRRFADPAKSLPIRIQAGALGDNLPARDLYVSPDHALLIDECLVQAGALVNGTTIARDGQVPQTFVYYHVELDDHSLVMVEGVAAETFVDNVSRRAFDNWQEAPEAPVAEMELPRAKAWRQLPQRTRDRIAARAGALSPAKAA